MKSVDWSKWSAIAEIVSSIAILLTLIYLAIQTQQTAQQNEQLVEQTKQNTAAIRSSTIQETSRWSYEATLLALEYPEVLSARQAACTDTVTEEQRAVLSLYYLALLRLQINRFEQARLGILDEDLGSTGGRGAAWTNPFFTEFFPLVKDRFDPGFADFMDREVLGLADEPCPFGY